MNHKTSSRLKKAVKIFSVFGLAAAIFVIVAVTLARSNAPVLQSNNGGLTVPEAWRGTWEVTVDYRDRATGALVATDVTTAAICPGEPIVPQLFNEQLHITGGASQNGIGVSCRAKHTFQPGCNGFAEVWLQSTRNDDEWRGTGGLKLKVVANCEHSTYAEDFEVIGRRVSSEAACGGESASLVQRFFMRSMLVPFIAGRNEP